METEDTLTWTTQLPEKETKKVMISIGDDTYHKLEAIRQSLPVKYTRSEIVKALVASAYEERTKSAEPSSVLT